MKIAVVGAGAMGCLFGGKLSAVAEVWLIDPWAEHVAAMQTRGLQLVEPDSTEHCIRVRAVSDPKQVAGAIDLALVFVKSNQTEWAAQQAAQILASEGLTLTLQNGLGNLDVIANILGDASVLQGVTAHGATLLGPGRVRHAGVGETHLASPQLATRTEISERVEDIAHLFNDAGFETHLSDNLDSLLWGKLVINVGINALTAILRVPNAALADVPVARNLLERAVNEAVAVAQAKQITLPYADPIGQVLKIARATGTNRSSMLQDVLRGAPTEIHVINGAIVREGERVGVSTPVNRTLTELVQAIEASYSLRVSS